MGKYYTTREELLIDKYNALDSDTQAKLKREWPRIEVIQEECLWNSSLVKIVEDAKEFAERFKKTLEDVSIEHSCYYPEYSSEASSEAHLEVKGLETDEQYHARLAELYEHIKYREEHDKREFERLRAKFSS